MTTVTVTIPDDLKEALEGQVKAGWYRSISEALRVGARLLANRKQKLTENGFTEEFEDLVLEAAQEPIEESREWNGKGSFTQFVRDGRKERYGDKD